MADFSDLIAPETVLTNATAGSKKLLFPLIAEVAADAYGLDAAAIVEGLAARERLGSTGFGGGIAIPHCKLLGARGVKGVFIALGQPIEFNAVDALPVDLVFALISAPDAGALHLKTLARVSRRLREPGFVAKLRGAGSRDALYALLTVADARDAA